MNPHEKMVQDTLKWRRRLIHLHYREALDRRTSAGYQLSSWAQWARKSYLSHLRVLHKSLGRRIHAAPN
jgi:hypothetical protein